MPIDAFRDGTTGVGLQYRTDGKLLNPRRLQAKTKVHKDTIRDFFFVEDGAMNTSTQSEMQGSMDLFEKDKTAAMQRVNTPSIFNLIPFNLTVLGNFEIPLQLFL